MKEYKFKKFGGEFIDDVGAYLREYLTKNPNISIYVGCDSVNRRNHTMYAVAICMYDTVRKDGVHYIFARKKSKKERVIFTRMWKEVEKSVEVSEYLEKELDGYIKRHTPEDLVNMRDENLEFYSANQDKLVIIDVDINSDRGGGHNKSNVAFEAARSYTTGLGYRTRFKGNKVGASPFAANSAADLIAKRA
jgi:predicted RNase H-related nuclease YkuK (DUF458 family)|tara:strand:+ start:21387 stop:21962 length:576 start_codon:yes stop_codon:yes gene_type:complete